MWIILCPLLYYILNFLSPCFSCSLCVNFFKCFHRPLKTLWVFCLNWLCLVFCLFLLTSRLVCLVKLSCTILLLTGTCTGAYVLMIPQTICTIIILLCSLHSRLKQNSFIALVWIKSISPCSKIFSVGAWLNQYHAEKLPWWWSIFWYSGKCLKHFSKLYRKLFSLKMFSWHCYGKKLISMCWQVLDFIFQKSGKCL